METTLSENSAQAVREIRSRVKPDGQIVFVSGNFNILHPGHMRLFSFAKERGDFLIVAVNNDRTPGALFPQDVRVQGVRSLSDVDYVIALHEPLDLILRELRPDIVVKGKEHEQQANLEKSIVESYGGKLLFSSGDTKYTSLDLLKRDFDSSHASGIRKPMEYLDRHLISMSDLVGALQSLKGQNVLVVGDTIVDEYITCEALGLSQEDPTIVVQPLLHRKFIGGAGIVASHAVGLGGNVKYFSVIGQDACGEFALERLSANGVEPHILRDESRPTTLKQRYRTQEKTLLRVNHLSQRSISDELTNTLFKDLKNAMEWADLIVFSDFNYGCLPQKLVNAITEHGHRLGKRMVADSQSSSQVGDICRFKQMELITPTEREARIGLKDYDSGLVTLAENLVKSTHAKNVFITLAGEGLLIHAPHPDGGVGGQEFLTDRLPAFNSAPRDTAGAGDSMLVATSMALAANHDIWLSAYIGSLASGCQVGRIGNVPLTTEDLTREIYY